MGRTRHADKRGMMPRAAAIISGAGLAIALTIALPISAHAMRSGGFHGGSGHFHGHSHSFTSFSLALGFPIYAGPPAYYYPYPYYAPVYYPPPTVVVPQSTPCQQGKWRQANGMVVNGVACLGADGNWRLAN